MLAEERYQKIEALIQEKGIVKASELTELFGVSLETVRRDLFFLETKGTLRRVHGGAARPQRRSEFRPFGERREEQSRETVSYTHLDVYKRQILPFPRVDFHFCLPIYPNDEYYRLTL